MSEIEEDEEIDDDEKEQQTPKQISSTSLQKWIDDYMRELLILIHNDDPILQCSGISQFHALDQLRKELKLEVNIFSYRQYLDLCKKYAMLRHEFTINKKKWWHF